MIKEVVLKALIALIPITGISSMVVKENVVEAPVVAPLKHLKDQYVQAQKDDRLVKELNANIITVVNKPVATVKSKAKLEKPLFNIQHEDERIINSKEFQCLAKNIYHEAGVESKAGKLAVATVTMNRVQKNFRGKSTVCDVVYHNKQFSWTLSKKKVNETPTGPLWEESKTIALKVLKGKRSNLITKDTLHYHADYVTVKWSSNMQYLTKVDTHLFYR